MNQMYEEAAEALRGQCIDNGFILVGEKTARAVVAEHRLPADGLERAARFGKFSGWLIRTKYKGKARWAIHGIRQEG